MAAPTTAFTGNSTGSITTTGEANGLLLAVGKGMNRVTFGFRGTFTSAVVAVRGHVTGLSASSYYPIPGVTAGSGLPVPNPVSISLTNSTNAALTFDTTGCDYVEVWAVSGTLTDLDVDATQFESLDSPPLIVQAQTSATTISANETFTDSTVLYFGTGNDIGVTWDGSTLNVSQAAANSAIYWGVAGAGIDHVFYGDTSGYNMTWDQSADSLLFADNAKLVLGTGSDITIAWDGTDLDVTQATANSSIKWGVSGAGIDHVFYGDTATYDLTWDQSADSLLFSDNTKLAIGSGSDIVLSWDATRLNVTQAATNSEIRWGVDGAGIDQRWYGDTASASMLWDQSADAVVFGGAAGITNLKVKQSTAVAITGATTLVLADSGGIFTVSQAAAYDIDLPSPTTGAGATYFFSLTGAAANNVTLTVDGSAATFVGSIQIDGTTIVATGSTLTFASGAASLGDSIMVRSIATNLYHVVCMGAAAGAITIA